VDFVPDIEVWRPKIKGASDTGDAAHALTTHHEDLSILIQILL
jgi:hypothetical protein